MQVERLRVEEGARLEFVERERLKHKTEEISVEVETKLRNQASFNMLEEVMDMATEVVYKRWQAAERARKRADAAAAEAAEEGMFEEGE